jgi:hypothetical protein
MVGAAAGAGGTDTRFHAHRLWQTVQMIRAGCWCMNWPNAPAPNSYQRAHALPLDSETQVLARAWPSALDTLIRWCGYAISHKGLQVCWRFAIEQRATCDSF